MNYLSARCWFAQRRLVAGLVKTFGLLAGLLLVLLMLPASAQNRRYVRVGGDTVPDLATSWTTSTADLQGAINSLSATGGEVWVAAGIYKPNPADRTISFSMRNSVGTYGGFRGSENSLASRPLINLSTPSSTTLSGEIGNSTATSDNTNHVLYNVAPLNRSAVLDGFVIAGGNSDDDGGGMYNNGTNGICSPTVRNCSFTANSASGNGGGLYNNGATGVSSLQLTACNFSGNVAAYGGGMYNNGATGTSNPRLINCNFYGNTAVYGGAMVNDGNGSGTSSPVLINCGFVGNMAAFNGGCLFNWGRNNGVSSPQLINCSLLSSNTASSGGGLYNFVYGGGSSNAQLTNCIFWHNGGSNTIYNDGDGAPATVAVTYSLLEPEVSNYTFSPTNLKTSASPFFSDTNLQLRARSPAINMGTNSIYTAANGPATDLGGNIRIANNVIDMGAYELPPDLSPVLFTRPTTITGTAPVTVVVNVFELNSVATNGLITVLINKTTQLQLTFTNDLTSLGGRSVQNSSWSFSDTNPSYYTLTSNQSVGPGKSLSFGLSGTLNPGATAGIMSSSVTVVGGSGGEGKFSNNVDTDRIEYFQ